MTPPDAFGLEDAILNQVVGSVVGGRYVVVSATAARLVGGLSARGWVGTVVVGDDDPSDDVRPGETRLAWAEIGASAEELTALGVTQLLVLDAASALAGVAGERLLTALEPWIVAVTALAPDGRRAVRAWEDTLITNGYERALFDGRTSYAVRADHTDLLDSFRPSPDLYGAGLIAEVERYAQAAESWARTAEQRYDESRAELAAAGAELDSARQAVVAATHTADQMLHSTSWRVTMPLREASRIGRFVVRGSKAAARGVVRPALDAGLGFVRGNERIRSTLRKVLARVPAVEHRLQRFADARPMAGHDK